jgi:hypothetical protein
MLCINPFRPRRGVEYGCGQCRVCRINKARQWTARIILESSCHVSSTFVTLTYTPEHLPPGGNLSREHWREFSKAIGYRYFGVGEYGDRGGRPHYHAVLFGIDAASATQLVSERWPYGLTQCLPLSEALIRYVARYTSKKYRQVKDSGSLIPEFTRMSTRPGLGALALPPLMDWLTSRQGAMFVGRNGDVPSCFRSERRIYPLGRYLVLKLRAAAGLPSALPELSEKRRQAMVLALSDVEFACAREARRQAGYVRASREVLSRKGSF